MHSAIKFRVLVLEKGDTQNTGHYKPCILLAFINNLIFYINILNNQQDYL